MIECNCHKDSNGTLKCPVHSVDQKAGFKAAKTLLALVEKQKKCRHNWLDMGQNSSIMYSKCLKCGLTTYYGDD